MTAILNAIRAVLGILILSGVALNFANVVGRYVFLKPIIWAEEVLVFIMIWCVMLGATLVTWEDQHLRMDAVYHLTPPRLRKTVTETHDAMVTSMGMVSKVWYDKLPPDLQKVLVEEGEAVQKELFDWTVEFNQKGRQTWTDKGGELIKLPAADQAELMKRLSTVGDEVVASQPRVKEVYDLMVQTAKSKR